MAGEQAIAHGAAVQRKAHMRTAIVDSKEAPIVSEHGDSMSAGADQRALASAQVGDRSDARPLGNQGAHVRNCSAVERPPLRSGRLI